MTVYRLLHRILPNDFATQLLVVVGLALAMGAGAGLVAGAAPGPLGVALLVSGAAVTFLMRSLMAPLVRATAAVEAWGRTGRVLPLPEDLPGDLGRHLLGVNRLLARAQRSLDRSWSAEDCDPVTGVLTREAAKRMLGDAGAGALIGVELCGLSEFRRAHGDALADDILLQAAHAGAELVRQDDIVARSGDQGLMLFLPGASEAVATRIIAQLAARLGLAEETGRIGACFGVARYGGGGEVSAALNDLARAVAVAQSRGAGALGKPPIHSASAA